MRLSGRNDMGVVASLIGDGNQFGFLGQADSMCFESAFFYFFAESVFLAEAGGGSGGISWERERSHSCARPLAPGRAPAHALDCPPAPAPADAGAGTGERAGGHDLSNGIEFDGFSINLHHW